jgi:hypothetical protein
VVFWFLSGRDTPSQDPLLSLAHCNHGRALAEAVRLVRITRPVILGPLEPTMHVRVTLRVANTTSAPIEVAVTATLPGGCRFHRARRRLSGQRSTSRERELLETEEERPMRVRLAPGEYLAFESLVLIPKDAQPRTEVPRYPADGLGEVSVKVVVQVSGAGCRSDCAWGRASALLARGGQPCSRPVSAPRLGASGSGRWVRGCRA